MGAGYRPAEVENMTREIKFRAWDKRFKLMTFISIINFGAKEVSDGLENIDFKDLEFLQFTGLLDKNGKEIYEGDIVTTFDNWKYKICYELDGYWVRNDNYDFRQRLSYETKGLEVIGNIYENPMLLEEKNK